MDSLRAQIESVKVNGCRVNLSCSDGLQLEIEGCWLRDNCRCEKCYTQDTFQRAVHILDIPEVTISSASTASAAPSATSAAATASPDHTRLKVLWSDGHQSVYDLDFIKQYNYDSWVLSCRREPQLWRGREVDQLVAHVLVEDFLSLNDAAKSVFKSLLDYGVAFIEGVTPDTHSTELVCQALGGVQQTLFGGMWKFTNVAEHADTAYTTLPLAPHTDSTYFTESTGMMLECLDALERELDRRGELQGSINKARRELSSLRKRVRLAKEDLVEVEEGGALEETEFTRGEKKHAVYVRRRVEKLEERIGVVDRDVRLMEEERNKIGIRLSPYTGRFRRWMEKVRAQDGKGDGTSNAEPSTLCTPEAMLEFVSGVETQDFSEIMLTPRSYEPVSPVQGVEATLAPELGLLEEWERDDGSCGVCHTVTGEDMIGCDGQCKSWYHQSCVNVRKAPVGSLQILHCIEHSNGTGGDTVLVDGFEGALDLKKSAPELFDLLTRQVFEAEYIEKNHHHRHAGPVIGLHPLTGDVQQVRFNVYDRTPGAFRSGAECLNYYNALKTLAGIYGELARQWWLKLRPGTVLVMDNWRVLHGRSAFNGKRVLCGSYVARSDWLDRARVLGLLY